MARVLVLGGGFGGLAAAHRLRELLPDDHEIALIDRKDTFFPGLVKLWDIVGIRSVAEASGSLNSLGDKGIRFVQAEIEGIDPEARSVRTNLGTFDGEGVVVSLGAAFSKVQVEMLGGHAHNLYDAAFLPAIKDDLRALDSGKLVIAILGVPYKCPPAPFEAAFLIDEWLRTANKRDGVEISVYTPQPAPLPVAGPEGSRRVSVGLAERGISLHTESTKPQIDHGAQAIRFAGGGDIDFNVLLAVPQHVAPRVLGESGLIGDSGWIEPERATLRTRFDAVYAIGDCTMIPIANAQLPKAGVFAEREGVVAAENLAAELGYGGGATFDGRGFCFLELGGSTAAKVQGEFFADPKPNVVVSEPNAATFAEKEDFARTRVAEWL